VIAPPPRTGYDDGDDAAPTTRASVRDALIVAVAGLVANGLNLLVTIVLARVLPIRDHSSAYGAFAQMVGLFIVVSLPGSAIAIAVVRRSSWWLARKGNAELEAWRRRVSNQLVRALGLFAILAAIAAPFVAQGLGGRSWVAVLLTSLGAGCWVAIAVERAFLQSCRRYHPLAANFLLEGLARTAAVLTGAAVAGVTGAVAGILIAELVTWAHAWWAATRAVPDPTRSQPGTPPRGELGGDLVAAICAFAMLALLQYADVFLVGRLNSSGSGRYAAIAVVAKTLVFVAIVLSYYLLPEASIGHRAGGHARRQLAVVLGLYAVPCAVLLLVAAVAPRTLLSLIYPERLLGASGSLAVLVAAMGVLGLSFLLATYLLARGVRIVAAWLVAGAAVAFWLIYTAHGLWHATALRDLESQLLIAAGLIVMTGAVLASRAAD
jgi:O-antigen/teichoic acid export membrane protein